MAGMKILIADDNVTMRSMIEKVIERIGVFSIDFAGNGNEALHIFRQKAHDLLIIDNIMPQKNGIDVLRELNDDQTLHRAHVIMITGSVTKELVGIIRTEFLKIDDLIVKPIDFDKLKEKVIAVAARVRGKNRSNGPVLNEGSKESNETNSEVTLTASIIDRGSIAIVDLKGPLINQNKSVINSCLKQLESIAAPTIIIDINGVETMDDFGCGTLAIMSGWLSMNEKEAFLACDDCAMKGKVVSLGINRLVPDYPKEIDPFKCCP